MPVQSVLHLSQFDTYGGSARAATRIHETIRALGVDSRMLVGKKGGNDRDVAEIARSKNMWRADVASYAITDFLGTQYLFNGSSFALLAHPWYRRASVLQLYNLHGGWFAHPALPLLTRRKPAVWRLSDMWPVTGHCAYSLDCERWRHGCGSCPHLDTYPRLRRDATAFNWQVKRAAYRGSRLTVVAPSRWLAGIARASPLFRGRPVIMIPTSVDTNVFSRGSRTEARTRLGLPEAGRIVLIVSREPRKGVSVVFETLARSGLDDLTLLVVGEPLTELGPVARGVRVVDLGLVQGRTLTDAYRSADALLLPSSADNLPNALLESMACGTPAVTVAAGGIPEAVNHLEDGYLVPTPDPVSLGEGLRLLLEDRELRDRLSEAAAARMARERSVEAEGRAYLALYEELA